MIDNPLADQVMEEKDNEYLSEQFYEHCADIAHSIAKEYNLLPGFYDEFAEYYTDLCLDSDEGYSIVNQKSLIDDWWQENKHIYDDLTPYINNKPGDYDEVI